MKNHYEFHITILANPDEQISLEADIKHLGWKFSKIDGDPRLGAGVKCYATGHANKDIGFIGAERVLNKAFQELVDLGYNVIRKKIELVVYDWIKPTTN